MTAVTPGREELRGEIAQALCCHGEYIRGEAACWKYTTSGHKKITDAILAIFDRLAAKPDEDGVREALKGIASECQRWRDEQPSTDGASKGWAQHLQGIAETALSTTGKPKRCR